MKKLKNLISQHRKASLLALFFLIVFVGFSATNAVNVAQHRDADAAQQESESTEQKDSGDKEDTDGADAKAALTDSQKKLIKGYDDKTKNLIETLCSSIWSANGGKYTLHFYDTYYTETVNGNEETHPYAISTVEYGTNGSDTEIDTIAFETDTGTHIATYSLVKSADSKSAGQSTVESTSMFQLKNASYERTDAVAKIKIAGLNSEITELLGDSDKLVSELSNWCSVHYPAATTATWSKNVTIDYNENIVVTSFSLGSDESDTVTGNSASVVSVTYNRSDAAYEFDL